MIRTSWFSMARTALRSLLFRLAGLRAAERLRRRNARFRRRRRDQFAFGPVAAELFEPRQLLSAAVTAVSPNTATANGGTTVNIMGSGFQNVTGVQFGSTSATSYQVLSSTAISAVAPAHSTGLVDTQVLAAAGNSPITSADHFIYTASPPTVTGVGPSSGSTSGGTSTTIT